MWPWSTKPREKIVKDFGPLTGEQRLLMRLATRINHGEFAYGELDHYPADMMRTMVFNFATMVQLTETGRKAAIDVMIKLNHPE